MITKGLMSPENPNLDDEWHNPDGHAAQWKRFWNGKRWAELSEKEEPEEDDLGNEDEDDEDDEFEDDEGDEDERSVSTEISDSDGEQESDEGSEQREESTAKSVPSRRGRKSKGKNAKRK